jgi:hypothetical protein
MRDMQSLTLATGRLRNASTMAGLTARSRRWMAKPVGMLILLEL